MWPSCWPVRVQSALLWPKSPRAQRQPLQHPVSDHGLFKAGHNFLVLDIKDRHVRIALVGVGQGGAERGRMLSLAALGIPVVLKHVSATFHPGRLAALMGPSGAGKTTLLDILAGRKGRAGEIQGEVLYAGEAVPKRNLKRFCGYMEQANVLLPEFTVEQMLLYTTELKLSSSVSYQDKRKRVDKLIDKLQLESCRKTKIGSTLHRGISGGQARRVSVGLALISHPALLLLDEPTSGLDSKMAAELCAVLKGLASDGFTLIATVHSPSAPAFACFDDLLLLSNGGEAYAGEVQHVQRHFEGMGFVMPRHSFGFSLPDWLLDVLSKEEDVCELWHKVDRKKFQHQ
ncbi:ABCG21, partial [Symbiodinium necroappetens]